MNFSQCRYWKSIAGLMMWNASFEGDKFRVTIVTFVGQPISCLIDHTVGTFSDSPNLFKSLRHRDTDAHRKWHFRYIRGVTSDPDPNPRVAVGLPSGSLRDRLVAALGRADVDLSSLDEDLASALADERLDLVVVRRSQVDDELRRRITEASEDPARPGVVVLDDDPDVVERVELVAAGASQVLDPAEIDSEWNCTGGSEPGTTSFLRVTPY